MVSNGDDAGGRVKPGRGSKGIFGLCGGNQHIRLTCLFRDSDDDDDDEDDDEEEAPSENLFAAEDEPFFPV
jgi:hypothetical protein